MLRFRRKKGDATDAALLLPDWRGPNYPQLFYTAGGIQTCRCESALPPKNG